MYNTVTLEVRVCAVVNEVRWTSIKDMRVKGSSQLQMDWGLSDPPHRISNV